MTIKLSILTRQHLQPAFELATQVFIDGSTLHRALGIGLEDYREHLQAPFEAMVAEGLSVVATDRASGCIVGCLIVSDFYHHLKTPENSSGRFAPLDALTSLLCRQYQAMRSLNVKEAILVDMGAVSPTATGKGVYQRMRNTAHDHARKRGFKWVVGELSSMSTQHVVLTKLGHEKMTEVVFNDFEHMGTFPFRSIEKPRSIVLAEGVLR